MSATERATRWVSRLRGRATRPADPARQVSTKVALHRPDWLSAGSLRPGPLVIPGRPRRPD